MNKFIQLIIALFVEGITLIGYLKSTAILPFPIGLIVSFVSFSTGIIFIFLLHLRKYGKQDSFWLAITLSFLSIALYQVMGFSFFPGLVKDISWFSQEHIFQISIMFLISLVVHIVLYFIAYQIDKLYPRKVKAP